MKHLVTGGAGFIGAHLCAALLQRGDEVICLDNLFTSRRANLATLLGHPRFEFVRADVCDPFHYEVDRIWSLACPASPIHYQRNAVRTVEASVIGTLNALKNARAAGARLLLTSTSEVYGDPVMHPQPESYRGNVDPTGPRACYDEGKRTAETLVTAFHDQYGVDARIARLFNTYGPLMAPDDGRVVSNFIVQALQGHPLTVYGHGGQTRSFAYVDDTVAGLLALMDAEIGPQPVNLGNPTESTITQLGQLVHQLVGDTGWIHKPALIDDPARRCPDISRAIAALGWRPTTALEDGLRRTIAYFRTRLPLVTESAIT